MDSITCPYGHGQTDKHACFDRALVTASCCQCAIPISLIAADGLDNLNRSVAARINKHISSPWKAPRRYRELVRKRAARAKARAENPKLTQKQAIAEAIKAAIPKAGNKGWVGEAALNNRYATLRGAPELPKRGGVISLLRLQGLPIKRVTTSTIGLLLTEEVNNFVQKYEVAV